MEQLGLFKPASFPQELLGNEYITLRPYHNMPDKGPVKFLLKDNNEYINLEETTLTIKCKITNANGTTIVSKIANDDQVASLIMLCIQCLRMLRFRLMESVLRVV